MVSASADDTGAPGWWSARGGRGQGSSSGEAELSLRELELGQVGWDHFVNTHPLPASQPAVPSPLPLLRLALVLALLPTAVAPVSRATVHYTFPPSLWGSHPPGACSLPDPPPTRPLHHLRLSLSLFLHVLCSMFRPWWAFQCPQVSTLSHLHLATLFPLVGILPSPPIRGASFLLVPETRLGCCLQYSAPTPHPSTPTPLPSLSQAVPGGRGQHCGVLSTCLQYLDI